MANHSYSHPYFSELTTEQCLAEIQTTHVILEKLYERAEIAWDKKYFRFPFGDDGSGTDIESAFTEQCTASNTRTLTGNSTVFASVGLCTG